MAEDGAAWVADTCAAVHSRLREGPATTQQLREALPALALRLELAPGKSYGGQFPVAPRVLGVLAAGGSVVRGEPAAGWKVSRPFWTTAEEWFGGEAERLGEREGYAELVRRWLWSFGPGTEADLVWWLGGTKTAVRQALGDIGAIEVRLADGSVAWLRADDTEEVAAPEPWAMLLPALDPTTMGWKGRDFYLGDLAPQLFDTNGNGGPTAWWNGRIVGGWTQTPDGAVVVVPAVSAPTRGPTPARGRGGAPYGLARRGDRPVAVPVATRAGHRVLTVEGPTHLSASKLYRGKISHEALRRAPYSPAASPEPTEKGSGEMAMTGACRRRSPVVARPG